MTTKSTDAVRPLELSIKLFDFPESWAVPKKFCAGKEGRLVGRSYYVRRSDKCCLSKVISWND